MEDGKTDCPQSSAFIDGRCFFDSHHHSRSMCCGVGLYMAGKLFGRRCVIFYGCGQRVCNLKKEKAESEGWNGTPAGDGKRKQ